ncbi:YceD family protein [Paenibacillus larvae]|uniref:YceD family protein n=1 Tax=Paenibacillus larvae TaxID=1464 RepID=UPI0034DFD109
MQLLPLLNTGQRNNGHSFRECFAEKTGGLEQQDQEKYDIHPAGEDYIDLSPYILENVMVSLPYAPLCKEACKGLCPNCGTNLNHQQCGCETDKIDPRLAGLADFFEK